MLNVKKYHLNKLLIISIISLPSCNSLKNAQKSVAKIAITHQDVLVGYCADNFPSKVWFIKGDTIAITDTIKLEGNVITDTLINLDTIRIVKTVTLPTKIITNTIHVTDTIREEVTAKIAKCELERSKTLDLLADANKKLTISQGKAKKRGIIMYSLIALVIAYSAWKAYNIFKPKTT